MKLDDRIEAVAFAAADNPWLGELTAENILGWVELELGRLLQQGLPQEYGHSHCLVRPLSPLLHIVSGNTPQAALQSLIRGVVVGAKNWLKLPRAGLPELHQFSTRLPETLRPELSEHLEPGWVENAEAIVVFGTDETVRRFSRLVLPTQRLLAHGDKTSFGLVWFPIDQDVVDGAAWDVHVFDQLGCLSPQLYYVSGDSECLPADWPRDWKNSVGGIPPRTFEEMRSLPPFEGFERNGNFAQPPNPACAFGKAPGRWTGL